MIRGRGTLDERSSGWWLRFREVMIDPATGKRVYRTRRIRLGIPKGKRNRAAARRSADAWLSVQGTDHRSNGPDILAVVYFAQFLTREGKRFRQSTRKLYRSLLNNHLVPRFGSLPLCDITAPRIRDFLGDLGERTPPLAPDSIDSIRRLLRQILSQARRDGFAAAVLEAGDVPKPRTLVLRPEPRGITRPELEAILAATDHPLRALYGLMGWAGLRCGEAAAVRWNDVDFGSRTLTVRATVSGGQLAPPKTTQAAAEIPMLEPLERILIDYRRVAPTHPEDRLFGSRTGRTLDTNNVRARHFSTLLKRLGLKPTGFHGFRRGLPQILADLGVSLGTIQRVLRHGSAEMSARYLRTAADDVRAQIDAARERMAARRADDAQDPVNVDQS